MIEQEELAKPWRPTIEQSLIIAGIILIVIGSMLTMTAANKLDNVRGQINLVIEQCNTFYTEQFERLCTYAPGKETSLFPLHKGGETP